jgi:hypothetical protein
MHFQNPSAPAQCGHMPRGACTESNLDTIFENWLVSDLRHVLDEVDRRLAIIELIDRLSGNPSVHESALHELIVRSLWMFGPEYEVSELCSNSTLRTVVKRLLGRSDAKLVSERNRPDIVVRAGCATYGFASVKLSRTRTCAWPASHGIVIVELKRGGSRLTGRDLSQVDGYAQDLAESGALRDSAFINAWIVGEEVAPGVPTDRMLCNAERCYARIRATSYSALAENAWRRFPGSFSRLRHRYSSMSVECLMERVFA